MFSFLSSNQIEIAKGLRGLLLGSGAVKKGTLPCVVRYEADWILVLFG